MPAGLPFTSLSTLSFARLLNRLTAIKELNLMKGVIMTIIHQAFLRLILVHSLRLFPTSIQAIVLNNQHVISAFAGGAI